MKKMRKKDVYGTHACEFKNEDSCQEELDEDYGVSDIAEAEKEHFEEEEEAYMDSSQEDEKSNKEIKK